MAALAGPSPFEALASLGHLRVTEHGLCCFNISNRAQCSPNSFCALRKQIFSMSAFESPSELSTLMVSRM